MPPRSHTAWTTRGWRVAYWLLCAGIFVFLVAPILVIAPLSFNAGAFFTYPLAGLSLRWYREFATGVQWQRAVANSLIVGLGATVVATSLGTLAALGLHRAARVAFRPVLVTILLSPMVVPVIITGVGMFYFYTRIGLANTLGGLIVAHAALGIPFVFVTVGAVLSTLDDNLVRAAASLGAGPVRVFRAVVLPLILPGVVSGALFAFVTSWDDVVVALFLAGPRQHTLPRQMWSGIREFISPTLLAVATLLIVLSISLMLVVEVLRRKGERLRGVMS
jgi:putative spermidine/putrescine transport system permease protein